MTAHYETWRLTVTDSCERLVNSRYTTLQFKILVQARTFVTGVPQFRLSLWFSILHETRAIQPLDPFL